MASYVKQHYIPELLLKQWHSGPDGKLTVMTRKFGKIRADRHKAGGAATIDYFYSIIWQGEDTANHDFSVEKKFFATQIETPAGSVLPKLLAQSLSNLTPNEKLIWAKFLVSQVIRVPKYLTNIETKASTLHQRESDFLKEITYTETEDRSDLYRNLARKSLEEIVNTPELAPSLAASIWGVRHFTPEYGSLLIGDSPVIRDGGLGGVFTWMLPISPQHVFIASSDVATFQKHFGRPAKEAIATLNDQTVQAAQTAVFGIDSSLTALVECYLSPSPLPADEATCAATTKP